MTGAIILSVILSCAGPALLAGETVDSGHVFIGIKPLERPFLVEVRGSSVVINGVPVLMARNRSPAPEPSLDEFDERVEDYYDEARRIGRESAFSLLLSSIRSDVRISSHVVHESHGRRHIQVRFGGGSERNLHLDLYPPSESYKETMVLRRIGDRYRKLRHEGRNREAREWLDRELAAEPSVEEYGVTDNSDASTIRWVWSWYSLGVGWTTCCADYSKPLPSEEEDRRRRLAGEAEYIVRALRGGECLVFGNNGSIYSTEGQAARDRIMAMIRSRPSREIGVRILSRLFFGHGEYAWRSLFED